jgi:hypothetical protein
MTAMTYREIGHALGISHGLVMLIERAALRKVRIALGVEEADEAAWSQRYRGLRERGTTRSSGPRVVPELGPVSSSRGRLVLPRCGRGKARACPF